MKHRTDAAHLFHLSAGVSPSLEKGITLKTRRETLNVDSTLPLNIHNLESQNLLSLKDNASMMDELMFGKFIRHLISISWATITIFPGLKLEICSLTDYDLLFGNKPLPEDFVITPGLVMETGKSQIRISDPKRKLVVEIESKLFVQILAKEAPTAGQKLFLLGILNDPSFTKETEPQDILSQAFHFRTMNNLDVMKNDKYIMKKSWEGVPVTIPPKGDFLKVVHSRRSGELETGHLPKLDRIKNLLENVYGSRMENDRFKLSYPSPGAGYSVKIKIVYPNDNQELLYDFDPISSRFLENGSSSEQAINNGWVRIYLIGNLTELNQRYQSIPYRLLILEAGVLLHQLSLITAYEKLIGRIVGYTNEAVIKTAFNKSFLDEDLIVGEYLVTDKADKDE